MITDTQQEKKVGLHADFVKEMDDEFIEEMKEVRCFMKQAYDRYHDSSADFEFFAGAFKKNFKEFCPTHERPKIRAALKETMITYYNFYLALKLLKNAPF